MGKLRAFSESITTGSDSRTGVASFAQAYGTGDGVMEKLLIRRVRARLAIDLPEAKRLLAVARNEPKKLTPEQGENLKSILPKRKYKDLHKAFGEE